MRANLEAIKEKMMRELAELQSSSPPSSAPPPPQFCCESCGGAGVVRHAVPFGHPDWGKLHPCPDPACPGGRRQGTASKFGTAVGVEVLVPVIDALPSCLARPIS